MLRLRERLLLGSLLCRRLLPGRRLLSADVRRLLRRRILPTVLQRVLRRLSGHCLRLYRSELWLLVSLLRLWKLRLRLSFAGVRLLELRIRRVGLRVSVQLPAIGVFKLRIRSSELCVWRARHPGLVGIAASRPSPARPAKDPDSPPRIGG